MQNVQEQKQDPCIHFLSLSLSVFIVPEFLLKLFHVSKACHSTKALEKLLVPHLFFHKRHSSPDKCQPRVCRFFWKQQYWKYYFLEIHSQIMSSSKEGTWRIVFNKFTNYNQQALNQERRTKCLHLWKLHLPKLPQLPPEVMQHVREWHADLLVGSKLLFQFLLFHCLRIWNVFPLHGSSRNLRMGLLLLLLDLLVPKRVQWDHQPEEEHQGNLFPTRVCLLAPAAICVELSVASHVCWIRRRRNTLHAWQILSQTPESLNRNGGWCLQGNSPSPLANLATIWKLVHNG